MNYSFGFSWIGLILFLLPMVPNIIYVFNPPKSSKLEKKNHVILDLIEHGSQAIFMFMLIFLIPQQAEKSFYFFVIAITMLIVYFGLWGLYFKGKSSFTVLLGLAIVPVLYFITAELWLCNVLAIIPTLIFGVVHVIITWMNYNNDLIEGK